MAHWDSWDGESDVTTPYHWDTWYDECKVSSAPPVSRLPAGGAEGDPPVSRLPAGVDKVAIEALIRFVSWMGTQPKDVILEHGEPLLRTTSKAKPPVPGVKSEAKPISTPWKRRRVWHRNSPSPEPPQLAAQ